MSKINKYLPKVLQPILEFQVINSTLDTELTNVNKLVVGINNEVIVATATIYGITRWENTLGIIPEAGDSLETRRFRIQNILNNKLPYTVRWLKNKLTEITGSTNGWSLEINNDDYSIIITLSGLDLDLMSEIEKQLRLIIPSNMTLGISGSQIELSNVYWATATHLGYKYLIGSNYDV